MLRAIRLVVDTGFHYKHWTRQQVVDFFHDHSTIDEVEVQSETDRYMAIPGQALGYKVGQLEILKLRAYAKDQLGDKFDIRGFHDEVLGAGALPMDVLTDRIHEWVSVKKASAAGAARKQQRALTFAHHELESGPMNACSPVLLFAIKCLIIPLLMPNDDSDFEFPQELDRLAKVYAHMTDGELHKVAADFPALAIRLKKLSLRS